MDWPRTIRLLLPALLFAAVACTEDEAGDQGAAGGAISRDLVVVSFEQEGSGDVRRDEPLVVRFSAPLDPSSLGPGSIRILKRRGNREQPIRIEVENDRVLLHPPSPFGFDGNARYWLIVEGFPSLRAPRSRDGQPLAKQFRRSFTTSRFYGPDLVPPHPTSVEMEEESGGSFTIRIRFSEPVEPRSVTLGTTLAITALEDETPISGRVIHDRRAEVFTFFPEMATHPTGVRVVLTPGILDLAGNPLRVDGREETIFHLPESPLAPSMGEITEDFATTRMMDPSGTTALWNAPGSPGVLSGAQGATTMLLTGDPAATETHLAAGGERLVIRMLVTRDELGPPRKLTSLLWVPAAVLVASEYRGITVSLVPTTRERLDESGVDRQPVVVLDQEVWRVDPSRAELLAVPFSRWFAYDGETNLIIEIRVGAGTHTNFFRARHSRPGTSIVRRGGKAEPLRPEVGFKSVSMEPTATSRFFDTGSDAPEYFEPVVHPAAMPRGVTMTLEFQGAMGPSSPGKTGGPDSPLSDWVEDVTLLSGFRHLRFRVTFRGRSVTGEEPALDDLVIPFRR
ncbi:MAG: Ig-like domain-containing domain [Planctomycetota bacterium]|jgi:hypothetical protein